ncbi:iron-containing redox enzyme family protein [Saccharothrix algeriensis]|uniref:Iron-containing redox enzyme family protein n=1 Tax=Saccharothrix algeriensis TaxID=173560 RepID=A0A8T8I288_9PSEU|nr:iron-containing redox enzyme family protein [Saccharothrix algeriensis]MBM7809817.1 hypothetical protein [Saccharothrix algeriensis]QTR04094.1 iron-containing redox enzyme family protein [Saccharothrix algeriensis]
MSADLTTARSAYASALDPECLLSGEAVVRGLRAVLDRDADPARPLPELRADVAAWARAERDRYLALGEKAVGDGDRASLVRRAVLGCAPLALRSGAWLQWLSGMGRAEDAVSLRVLALYAGDVGAGHPHASRGAAFLAVLRELRLAEHAVPAANLVLDERVPDWAFHVPAVLLLMSRRPDEFDAELLGADLCLRTVGLLPALRLPRDSVPADWAAIDPACAREPGGEPALALAEEVATARAADAERVALGFRWACAALRRWNEDLRADLDAALDPAHDMAELIRLRAREGAVYHQDYRLGEDTLSALLARARTDPAPVLAALAGSRLVKPGDADGSPLVNGLIGERGPMFRVFAPEDVTVIRRWIDGLPDARTAPPRVGTALPALPPLEPDEHGTEPADIRDAYHRLLSRADTPALRAWARRYVRGWLARSAHHIDDTELMLPRAWPAEGLRPWLVEQHDRHDREFEAGSGGTVPSRQALVESTVQLAPLTLIDGSWLQGFTDYEQASGQIGFSLFETYWDELGNGEVRLNHPLIYRALLREMGVEPPPTATPAFARWEGFHDRSFELPVYWLSLGRFPRTFLPEVLGMNLAMELSGVGGSYRRARIALKEHGFSTRFVDIHNTIDNVASGHSAWAADAIATYMCALPADATDHAWSRVRVGFRSLTPPDGHLARRAQRKAARR